MRTDTASAVHLDDFRWRATLARIVADAAAGLGADGTVEAEHWAAFYTDCRHELRPVRSGFRVALVYDLVRRSGRPPHAPDHRQEVDAEDLDPGVLVIEIDITTSSLVLLCHKN